MPAAAVQSIPEMIKDPQIAHLALVSELSPPPGHAKPVTMVGAGFTTAAGRGATDRPPPVLGQHTDAILAELGYAKEEIAALRAARAV